MRKEIHSNSLKILSGGRYLNSLSKKERDSNLELFRIIVMILIIAHHYVVNSGLTAADGPIFSNPLSSKSIFLLLFGMWGKTGINCFVLITGYFMCKSNITLRKFLKLLLEVYFYRVVFFIIFIVTGYQSFHINDLIKAIFPINSVSTGFTGCYLLFFLFIPFLNKLINSMTEKEHLLLIALCSFIYVVLGTIPKIMVSMNYVSWFVVIYFIASYIRLYPKKWFDDKKITGIACLITITISILSVIVMNFVYVRFNLESNVCFYFVADSNKILAVLTAISCFCYFKNIKIKNNKFINKVASTTFGVLLIHANSDAMRQWLWKDILNNVGKYDGNYMFIHAFISVAGVFAICSIIDVIRQEVIEKPFFDWFDTKEEKIIRLYERTETKILSIFKEI